MNTVDKLMALADQYALVMDYYSDIPSEPAREALRAAIVEALAAIHRPAAVRPSHLPLGDDFPEPHMEQTP